MRSYAFAAAYWTLSVFYALAATFHFAQQLAGPGGQVIDQGDTWLIQSAIAA